ncbi:MAG TPA: glycosyltransferase family 39 protein, partial [Chitinophagaceae bacterium]|nr:glycosyltransferase family 39 protein [Chitinophagaceae bacterium]
MLNRLMTYRLWGWVGILWTVVLFLLVLVACTIYREPAYIWDEALYLNNAIEMHHYHDYSRALYGGVPDFYNSKPLLAVWLESFFFSMGGYAVWIARIPSFLALVGTLILMYRFVYRWLKNVSYALLSLLLLLSCPGAIRPHVFLTADPDALLVFFSTAFLLFFTDAVLKNVFSVPRILLLYCMLALGFLSKSIAIFFVLPPALILIVWSGLWKKEIKRRIWYSGGMGLLLFMILYYGVREKIDPGYLKVVMASEWFRFGEDVMFWHRQPFDFYFTNIIHRWNPVYVWVDLNLLLIYSFLPEKKYNLLVYLGHVMVLCYLLFISIPPDKLEWYDASIYPFWMVLLCFMLAEILPFVREQKNLLIRSLPWLMIPLGGWHLTQYSLQQLTHKRLLAEQEKAGSFLLHIHEQFHWKQYKLYVPVGENKWQHQACTEYYRKQLAWGEQVQVHFIRSIR